MNNDFYQNVTYELLKALRGKYSQAMLAKKIDVDTKVISKLETGQKRIYWSDFISISIALKIPLAKALKQLLSLEKDDICKPTEISKVLIGDIAYDKVSQELDVSTSKVRRWRNGEVEIQLVDVIKLLNLRGALFNFIGRITKVECIPTLYKQYTFHKDALSIFAAYPEASPIMLCLSLEKYKNSPHREGFIADFLRISIEQERSIIERLHKAKLIEFVDSRYQEKENYIGLNWSNPEQQKLSHQVKLNWLKKSLESFEGDIREENSSLAFQVYAVDKKMAQDIQQEIRKFNLSIHRILEQENTEPIEDIYLFTHQTVKLN
jgi:DNA-binding XRE family transcriptional regulator